MWIKNYLTSNFELTNEEKIGIDAFKQEVMEFKKYMISEMKIINVTMLNDELDSLDILERVIKQGGTIVEFMVTLSWSDWNDLDLHVVCPCGTEVYYGRKQCVKCKGYLDVDMNVCHHVDGCALNKCSMEPIEHFLYPKNVKVPHGVF